MRDPPVIFRPRPGQRTVSVDRFTTKKSTRPRSGSEPDKLAERGPPSYVVRGDPPPRPSPPATVDETNLLLTLTKALQETTKTMLNPMVRDIREQKHHGKRIAKSFESMADSSKSMAGSYKKAAESFENTTAHVAVHDSYLGLHFDTDPTVDIATLDTRFQIFVARTLDHKLETFFSKMEGMIERRQASDDTWKALVDKEFRRVTGADDAVVNRINDLERRESDRDKEISKLRQVQEDDVRFEADISRVEADILRRRLERAKERVRELLLERPSTQPPDTGNLPPPRSDGQQIEGVVSDDRSPAAPFESGHPEQPKVPSQDVDSGNDEKPAGSAPQPHHREQPKSLASVPIQFGSITVDNGPPVAAPSSGNTRIPEFWAPEDETAETIGVPSDPPAQKSRPPHTIAAAPGGPAMTGEERVATKPPSTGVLQSSIPVNPTTPTPTMAPLTPAPTPCKGPSPAVSTRLENSTAVTKSSPTPGLLHLNEQQQKLLRVVNSGPLPLVTESGPKTIRRKGTVFVNAGIEQAVLPYFMASKTSDASANPAVSNQVTTGGRNGSLQGGVAETSAVSRTATTPILQQNEKSAVDIQPPTMSPKASCDPNASIPGSSAWVSLKLGNNALSKPDTPQVVGRAPGLPSRPNVDADNAVKSTKKRVRTKRNQSDRARFMSGHRTKGWETQNQAARITETDGTAREERGSVKRGEYDPPATIADSNRFAAMVDESIVDDSPSDLSPDLEVGSLERLDSVSSPNLSDREDQLHSPQCAKIELDDPLWHVKLDDLITPYEDSTSAEKDELESLRSRPIEPAGMNAKDVDALRQALCDQGWKLAQSQDNPAIIRTWEVLLKMDSFQHPRLQDLMRANSYMSGDPDEPTSPENPSTLKWALGDIVIWILRVLFPSGGQPNANQLKKSTKIFSLFSRFPVFSGPSSPHDVVRRYLRQRQTELYADVKTPSDRSRLESTRCQIAALLFILPCKEGPCEVHGGDAFTFKGRSDETILAEVTDCRCGDSDIFTVGSVPRSAERPLSKKKAKKEAANRSERIRSEVSAAVQSIIAIEQELEAP